MSSPSLHLTGLAWVLGNGQDSTTTLPAAIPAFAPATEAEGLINFSCKSYLQSNKGYLDAGAHYLLAAASLLRQAAEKQGRPIASGTRTGMACLTHYGAVQSGFTFFTQMQEKGPRFASPLIFPQSYSNTPPNLTAIEFSWSGPHSVYAGLQDCRLPWQFALDRLADGSADCILLAAYEASPGDLLPPSYQVRNGALVLRLENTAPAGSRQVPPALLAEPRLPSSPAAAPQPQGSVQAQLRFLDCLLAAGG